MEPDELEAGFLPLGELQQHFEGPVLAVVTKPPTLGLAMFQSEKVMGMLANTSMPDPARSAVTGKVTVFVTPCMSRVPVAV